ncbi:hypothetical protein [Adhaeretor mobilis]|uniref:Uncharacterized protein n=1 Tax=Adhaeretor mobilis TaxID=1930276 RepID=A0A517MW66_9BACT|nr:hypothetical protein [Adhaeretor mobilis]QDS99037.1 hypothetical protein HG15A2_23260 [Adhaeretor mobilis]
MTNKHSTGTDDLNGFQEMALQRDLQEVHDAPPLREEFVNSLGTRLGRAFEDRTLRESRSLSSVTAAKTPRARTSTGPRTSLRKGLSLVAGLAASILVAAFIFLPKNKEPQQWMAMLEAVEDQQWVEAQSNEKGASRFWISNQQRISAEQSVRGTLYREFSLGRLSNYSPRSKKVTINKLSTVKDWNIQAQLLSAILPAESLSGDVVVISETSRELKDRQGRRRLELNVKIQQLSPPHDTCQIKLLLNPSNHLPLSCEIASDKASRSVKFSYPQTGPQTIYFLGVPEDATVQDEE